MKIIKRGVIPEEVPHRITCRHCKSEIEYMKNEVETYSDYRDPGYDYIKCLVCSRAIVIKNHAQNSWDAYGR